MPGYVYGVYNPYSHLIKIGFTCHPKKRLRDIEVGGGVRVDVVAVIEVSDPAKIESEIHEELEPHRILGEWFSCDKEVARSILYERAKKETSRATWGRKKYFRKINFYVNRKTVDKLVKIQNR